MSSIPNRGPNIPIWGATAYGVAKGDWVGQDSAGNDLVVPGVKLVTGATGSDGGYVTNANRLPVAIPYSYTNPLPVQPMRDYKRSLCTFSRTGQAVSATEEMIELNAYYDLVSTGSSTSHGVHASKRLRIQTIMVTVVPSSSTAVGGIIRLRMENSGGVTVTSRAHATLGATLSQSVEPRQAKSFSITVPEGMELSNDMQFGVSQQFSSVDAEIDVEIIAYEYDET